MELVVQQLDGIGIGVGIGNVMNMEMNAHASYDQMKWSIQAVDSEDHMHNEVRLFNYYDYDRGAKCQVVLILGFTRSHISSGSWYVLTLPGQV